MMSKRLQKTYKRSNILCGDLRCHFLYGIPSGHYRHDWILDSNETGVIDLLEVA